MDQDTLRFTLDALRKEVEGEDTRVRELHDELESALQRLQHLRGAVQNIQFIVGELPSDAAVTSRPLAPFLVADIHGRDSGAGDEKTEQSFNPPADIQPGSGVKRTPSTEWMIEVINASGRAMTREEAFTAYEREKGIPESWTNPRTAMANALGRAVKRELIQMLPGDRYAPLGFDPYADRGIVPDERASGPEES